MSDQPSAHDLRQPTGTPADCPYYRGAGTCMQGGMNCHGEPRCITDEPGGGWRSEP